MNMEVTESNKSEPELVKIKVPRLYHKKSKTGCQRCKKRRVKCDELQPACGSCRRHTVPCIYIYDASSSSKPTSKHTKPSCPTPGEKSDSNKYAIQPETPLEIENVSMDDARILSGPDPTGDYLLESKARRKLELRLLQNFFENTSQTFSACHNTEIRNAWAHDATKLALEHDNLLYEIFSISASHLLKSNPDDQELLLARQAYVSVALQEDQELLLARQAYVSVALQEQRNAVAKLGPQNADAVCLASSLILIDSFASLQDRSLSPYLPPMEWLRIARGGASLYSMALHTLGDLETTRIRTFVMAEPVLTNLEVLFSESNRERFVDLLTRDRLAESWDQGTQSTYEKALSYIGGIQIEIERGEHQLATLRRMLAFPLLVPKEFVSFVEEKRPRALVVLAHFIALAANMNGIWWIGDMVQRELEGIRGVLPVEWQVMMHRPLLAAGLA